MSVAAIPPAFASTWDDTIVPALRRRLEGESRLLNDRLSMSSTMSQKRLSSEHERATNTENYYPSPAPSPTLTPPRPTPPAHKMTPPRPRRARTYSQPQASHIRPTRIPIAVMHLRTSPLQGTSAPSSPLQSEQFNRVTTPEIYPESYREVEQKKDESDEEHAFEHWYRGDALRNGGVGEFRLGQAPLPQSVPTSKPIPPISKERQMLEIAESGHTLGPYANTLPRRRPRADSLGNRESLYLDDARAKDLGRVLDEGMLTDEEIDRSDNVHRRFFSYGQVRNNTAEATAYHDNDNISPTNSTTPYPKSKIPAPPSSSRNTTPLSPSFPTDTPAMASTSTLSSKRAVSPRAPAPAQRKKKKSSAPPTDTSNDAVQNGSLDPPSNNIRGGPPKSKSKRKILEEQGQLKSIGYYPEPVGEGLEVMMAIPTWTEPTPRDGEGWDEVVLPAVAKKRGLDKHFEKADGSPKVLQPDPRPNEPAPGTFGYDHSKYRPPRDDGHPISNSIPMTEFGISQPPTARSPPRPTQVLRQPQSQGFPDMARPRPAPVPPVKIIQTAQPPPEKHAGGCCKCVIM